MQNNQPRLREVATVLGLNSRLLLMPSLVHICHTDSSASHDHKNTKAFNALLIARGFLRLVFSDGPWSWS